MPTIAAAPGVHRPADRAFDHRRLAHLPGRQHRVNDGRLAAHVATGEVGRGAQADPDRVDARARPRSAPSASAGSSVLKRLRLAGAGSRSGSSRVGNHVRRAGRIPSDGCRPSRGSGTSPRSGQPVITSYLVPEIRPQYLLPSSRLRREMATTSLTDRLHAAAVDVGVDPVGGRQRRARHERFVAHPALRIEQRLELGNRTRAARGGWGWLRRRLRGLPLPLLPAGDGGGIERGANYQRQKSGSSSECVFHLRVQVQDRASEGGPPGRPTGRSGSLYYRTAPVKPADERDVATTEDTGHGGQTRRK